MRNVISALKTERILCQILTLQKYTYFYVLDFSSKIQMIMFVSAKIELA